MREGSGGSGVATRTGWAAARRRGRARRATRRLPRVPPRRRRGAACDGGRCRRGLSDRRCGRGSATTGADSTTAGATGAAATAVAIGGTGAAIGVGCAASAAGAAPGRAARAAAGAGSRLVASLTSVAALRNSRMLLPSADPTSGSLPGPTTISAMIRMMMSSPGPIPLMNGMTCFDLVAGAVPLRGLAGVRVAQRGSRPSRRRPPRAARRGRSRRPPVEAPGPPARCRARR